MKKLLSLATAVILLSSAYAHDGKECSKDKKSCCKKEASAKKDCCKKGNKEAASKGDKTSTPANKKA